MRRVAKYDVRCASWTDLFLLHLTCCKTWCSVCPRGPEIFIISFGPFAKYDMLWHALHICLFGLSLNMIFGVPPWTGVLVISFDLVPCASVDGNSYQSNLLQNMMFGVPPCTRILVTSFGLFRNMIFDTPRASNFWLFHLTYWERWCHFWLFHLTLCPRAWEFSSLPSDMSQISVPACKEILVTPLDSLQNIIFGVPPYFIWLWLSVCPRTSFKYNFK